MMSRQVNVKIVRRTEMRHRMRYCSILVLALMFNAGAVTAAGGERTELPRSGIVKSVIADSVVSKASNQSAPRLATSEARYGEQINWQVISAGGTDGNTTNFRLTGTAGQTAVGTGSSTNFGVNHGFWQEFDAPCDCSPGDADASGTVDIDDVVYAVNYIFGGGPAPRPYEVCSGDPNCSCIVDIDDVVYLVAFIFTGGPAPCTCEEWTAACGSQR